MTVSARATARACGQSGSAAVVRRRASSPSASKPQRSGGPISALSAAEPAARGFRRENKSRSREAWWALCVCVTLWSCCGPLGGVGAEWMAGWRKRLAINVRGGKGKKEERGGAHPPAARARRSGAAGGAAAARPLPAAPRPAGPRGERSMAGAARHGGSAWPRAVKRHLHADCFVLQICTENH